MYIGAGLLGNFFLLQAFCTPVWWATVYCLVFLVALLYIPFVKQPWVKGILYFLLGAGTLACLYTIIFLADPWNHFSGYIYFTFQILLLGLGLLAFIPVYLLWHIYKYVKPAMPVYKKLFIAGLVAPLVILCIYLHQFKEEYRRMNYTYYSNKPETLQANEYTEQLLGIGYKYHTKLEYIYDGWRPPLHHPFLNIGLWLYAESYFPFKNLSPPFIELNRPFHYKRLFPHHPLKVNCVCSFTSNGKSFRESKF